VESCIHVSLRILLLHYWVLLAHIVVLQGAKCKTREAIINYSRNVWHGGSNSSWDFGTTWQWWCWWYDLMLHLFMATSCHSIGCRGLNHCLPCSPLCALGLNVYLHWGEINGNETCPNKLVAAWIHMLLTCWMVLIARECKYMDFFHEHWEPLQMRETWQSLFGWRSPCSLPFVGGVVMRTNGLGMPPSIVLCPNATCVSVLSFHPYVCATFAFQVLDSFLSLCLSFSLQGKSRCMHFVVDFVVLF